MSSALAIAAVTATLKSVIENGLVQADVTSRVGDISVTALPPDRIATGGDERSQLNLFLYRMTPNSAWRAAPHHGAPQRGTPLALDLHYLMTAYGAQDFHAEVVLGAAMRLLHGARLLATEVVQGALPAASPLEQVDPVQITPEFLSTEEMSRLWSSLQAPYRLSATYLASVVLLHPSQ